MNAKDMNAMESMFQRHIGVLSEDLQWKLDLIVEGHAVLDRKIDQKFDQLNEKIEHNTFLIGTLNSKIDAVATDLKVTDKRLCGKIDAVAADLKATDKRLSGKIDAVATDIKAHRADTELHHGVYQVKEG